MMNGEQEGNSGEDKRLIEADHQGIDTVTASCESTFYAVVDGEGVFRLSVLVMLSDAWSSPPTSTVSCSSVSGLYSNVV
jgi:hypothetical protein